jgi:transposase
VEGQDGGVVFLFGAAAYALKAGMRRLAAVQLVRTKTASRRAVTAGFGCNEGTVGRWERAYADRGRAGRAGPKGGWRLTPELAERIRAMDGAGATLVAIATATAVGTDR